MPLLETAWIEHSPEIKADPLQTPKAREQSHNRQSNQTSDETLPPSSVANDSELFCWLASLHKGVRIGGFDRRVNRDRRYRKAHVEQKDLSQMLETAIVAARLGGQHAMEQINNVKATVKNGNELVTQADRQCQEIIIGRIKETFPDHGFIAEEGEDGKLFKRVPRGTPEIWWAIDPIDGTNNFAHGIPVFTVSIAAMLDGRPIVGIIFDPATESMYSAVRDGEAYLNGRRLSAGEEDLTPFAGIGLDNHFPDPPPAGAGDLVFKARFRNFGTTALHLAFVASGGLVGTVICTPKLWDIAAGMVIAEAAGAIVTDWQGQAIFPVDLAHYEGHAFPSIVANKLVHPKLLATLNS